MTEEIIDDRQSEVRRLVSEGVLLGQQGRFTDAALRSEQARDTASALGFRDEEMQALLTLSGCAMVAGDHDAADRHLARVHVLAHELGDDSALAKCALNRGSLAMKRDPAAAIRYFREAAVAFERSGDPLGAAQSLANTGSVYWQMGALRTAFTYIHQARDSFASAGQPAELATSLLNLGAVLTDIVEAGLEPPDPVQANAGRLFDEALRIAEEIRSPYHCGRALDQMGLLRRVQGHAEEAVKLHERACEYFNEAGARSTLSSALLHLGSAYQLIPGKEGEALEAYQRCRALKVSLGDIAGIGHVCHNEGVLLVTLGRFREGRERLAEAIKLHGDAGGVVADPELATSDRQEVEKSWREYLCATFRMIASGALPGTTLLDEREHRVGQVLLAELQGEIPSMDRAGTSPLEWVRRRVELRERVADAGLRRKKLRTALSNGRMTEEEFALKIQEVVHDGFEAMFALHRDAADLETIRRPGAAHERGTSVPSDDPALTIVHLSDFPNHESLVFGVVRAGAESLHPYPLPPAERTEIYTALDRLRFAFATDGSKMAQAEAALGTLSRLLGDALAKAGVLDALSGAEGDVLLLLDSEWNLMPWEAAACEGVFLGTRYRLVRSFSRTLPHLPGTRKELGAKRRERPSASLFCPDPAGLRGSLDEVERVAAELESAGWDPHTYVGRRATPARFVATLRRSRDRIIHFSGHSLFHPTDALLSAILLHPGGSSKHAAGRLTALEIQSLAHTASSPIVYLSSCESGIADVREGNEGFGLSRAFLLAGAGSLVLANWPVWDVSAPDAATAFYAALLQGASPGEALRSARCEVAQRIATGQYLVGGDLVHWAPFAAYGHAPFEAQLGATA